MAYHPAQGSVPLSAYQPRLVRVGCRRKREVTAAGHLTVCADDSPVESHTAPSSGSYSLPFPAGAQRHTLPLSSPSLRLPEQPGWERAIPWMGRDMSHPETFPQGADALPPISELPPCNHVCTKSSGRCGRHSSSSCAEELLETCRSSLLSSHTPCLFLYTIKQNPGSLQCVGSQAYHRRLHRRLSCLGCSFRCLTKLRPTNKGAGLQRSC